MGSRHFLCWYLSLSLFISLSFCLFLSLSGPHGQSSPTMFELSWLTIVIVSDHHLYQLWLTQITLSLPSLNPKYNKEDILTPLELTQVRNTNYRTDHQLIQCMGVQNYLRPISIGRSHMECSYISDLSHLSAYISDNQLRWSAIADLCEVNLISVRWSPDLFETFLTSCADLF